MTSRDKYTVAELVNAMLNALSRHNVSPDTLTNIHSITTHIVKAFNNIITLELQPEEHTVIEYYPGELYQLKQLPVGSVVRYNGEHYKVFLQSQGTTRLQLDSKAVKGFVTKDIPSETVACFVMLKEK